MLLVKVFLDDFLNFGKQTVGMDGPFKGAKTTNSLRARFSKFDIKRALWQRDNESSIRITSVVDVKMLDCTSLFNCEGAVGNGFFFDFPKASE